MPKSYLDITGNIRTLHDKNPKKEKEEQAEDKAIPFEQKLEQELANLHLDDEEIELKASTCPRDTENLMECPLFVEAEDDGIPETVECAICGRFDWRKKESLL